MNKNRVFRHFRYWKCKDVDNCVVSEKGGLTILVDKGNIKEGKLSVSISVCNRSDNFNRKIGRSLTTERMEKGTTTIISFIENSYKESFAKAFPSLFLAPTKREIVRYKENIDLF